MQIIVAWTNNTTMGFKNFLKAYSKFNPPLLSIRFNKDSKQKFKSYLIVLEGSKIYVLLAFVCLQTLQGE